MANTWLEGSYTEFYPNITRDADGMRQLFRQFSFPGGIPSHVAPETPGSIHEGGELGYSLAHAFGAAFDNPDLIVACVVGDGEAETGPLATAWHSNKFLDPSRDGAVLPILHPNGYKIANPTQLARISYEELNAYVECRHGDQVMSVNCFGRALSTASRKESDLTMTPPKCRGFTPAALRLALGSVSFGKPIENWGDEITSLYYVKILHEENRPRNVVQFAGDVGLNTYLLPVQKFIVSKNQKVQNFII